MLSFSSRLHNLLDTGPFASKKAHAYRWLVTLAALAGTGVQIASTVDGWVVGPDQPLWAIEALAVAALTVDLVVQLMNVLVNRGAHNTPVKALRRYLVGPYGLFDVLAVLPFYVELVVPLPPDLRMVLGLTRFLKLARYSPALESLGSVLRREFRPLQSAVFIMALLMLGSSTALYLVERHLNPAFAGIPQAMWWSIATLTTLGYGDVVPISPLGKLLGGVVAVLGVGMFALPASIMATGFAEEMRRRDFLATWHMVAKVPFFDGLNAQQIAAITSLLKFQTVALGDVLIRAGEEGDCMYFIVSGSVDVDFGGARPVILKDGDFFGEIALLRNTPRTATVRARGRCQLLLLDVKDFRQFLAGSPQVAQQIAATAEQRLSQQHELVD